MMQVKGTTEQLEKFAEALNEAGLFTDAELHSIDRFIHIYKWGYYNFTYTNPQEFDKPPKKKYILPLHFKAAMKAAKQTKQKYTY